nr:RNA polymerase b'-subunit [Coccidia sp. AB-2023a]
MYYNNLSGFKISLASPQDILNWCKRKINNTIITGEISEPVTIDFKTGIPEPNGLFCERIFGPINSWKCNCGKYKNEYQFNLRKNLSNKFCEICGTEVNDSRIRRYRMGYIKLNTPIIHNWYLKTFIPLILNISSNKLEDLLYYKALLENKYKSIFFKTYTQLNLDIKNKKEPDITKLLFANEYFYNKLKSINLLTELKNCRELLANESNIQLRQKLYKKAQILHLFFTGNMKLEWLFLTLLPVSPAGLRPFFKLNSGKFINSPLNEVYRSIIIRNNRLKRWQSLRHIVPINFEIFEKLKLQESIDKLYSKTNLNEETNTKNIYLGKTLQGKFGRFRQNILGKRVDYSGRSVIVSGSDLPLGKLGIPSVVALELFKPIILNILRNNPKILTLLKATYITQYNPQILKSLLRKIFENEILFVNRAPTLHRINIQAFKPYLIEGEAFKLYPLACSSFNADFDGDQVGIFLPIFDKSKKEAKSLVSFDKNIFSPSSVKNMFKPTQSIILGLYSLLNINKISNLVFSSIDEIIYAYTNKLITSNTALWIKLKTFAFPKQYIKQKFILTTVGKILLEKYLQL